MHEITKYFMFTENQKQCLNPSYPTPAACRAGVSTDRMSYFVARYSATATVA